MAGNLIDEVRGRRKPPTATYAKAIRQAADVSQERLAQELGVHRITIARWEAGTRTPRGTLAAAYAQLLNDLQGLNS